MTAKEIREMESDKIIKNIKELKEELFNLRFQSAANKLENPMRFRLVRKDIARMIYENYGLEKIYNYLYEATEESEDELPVEDRVKELTNDFKNTNGSYVFEDGQDANKAVSILKSRGYEASQKRTQDGKYRVTANKKNK